MRAVVRELDARGFERLSPWLQHRNDEWYTVFLAPGVDPGEIVSLVAAETLRTESSTGCHRGPATALTCSCPDGAWQQVVLAERRR
ncbi:MAG: hypothetical protein JRI23_22015 [Deltaproteobacteria bacterium]|nr:hypothetical protein [Deltaproteobacteria bacterium]MBW2534635.1 hypothetical protein [Deltaproteobacteria bacterium]